jgi:hypothetical protein
MSLTHDEAVVYDDELNLMDAFIPILSSLLLRPKTPRNFHRLSPEAMSIGVPA